MISEKGRALGHMSPADHSVVDAAWCAVGRRSYETVPRMASDELKLGFCS